MKKDIQPNYEKTTIRCVCGNEIEVGSIIHFLLVKSKLCLAKEELLNLWKNMERKLNVKKTKGCLWKYPFNYI